MPKVFVTQETDHNLVPAEKYGQLDVLLEMKDVFRGSTYMCDKLDKRLHGIKPTDYIVCVGDPAAIGLTIHKALQLTGGTINILRWDKKKYQYTSERLTC